MITLLGKLAISFVMVSLIFIWHLFEVSDEYRIHKYLQSPTGTGVGVIVANDGGGAVGWCRDLVYNFQNSIGPIPDLSKEKQNRKYLVASLECGEAKDIEWNGSELFIIN